MRSVVGGCDRLVAVVEMGVSQMAEVLQSGFHQFLEEFELEQTDLELLASFLLCEVPVLCE